MNPIPLPLDQIIHNDCVQALNSLPENSVDLIFADPPYNLQLQRELFRPNSTRVDAVNDKWDQFDSFEAYDTFTNAWLRACKRVLKAEGTIWVIGTYHNIFRVGAILQDLDYWILNDVIWIKNNPMPNFRGVRFTNAHETLIWASRTKGKHYHFDHHAMKSLNDDLQMRSDWYLPICNGQERIRTDGKKAHPTQKPEALLYRVILAASQVGDVVLDPFFGSGTTGAVAKKLHRHWIGIEADAAYVEIASQRLESVHAEPFEAAVFTTKNKLTRREQLRFGSLLEHGLLNPGQALYFNGDIHLSARIKPDGSLLGEGFSGSIHQTASQLSGGNPVNGWDHWYYLSPGGEIQTIDTLRQQLAMQIQENKNIHHPKTRSVKAPGYKD